MAIWIAFTLFHKLVAYFYRELAVYCELERAIAETISLVRLYLTIANQFDQLCSILCFPNIVIEALKDKFTLAEGRHEVFIGLLVNVFGLGNCFG